MNDAATLDYVKSRLDILDCINRYSRGVDRFDKDALLSAFHADAVLDYGVFTGTPAQFIDYFYDLHRRHHALTAHMICNHTCDLTGDVAHTETYFAVANNNNHEPPFTYAGGRYVDKFERRNGRWAIAVRKCVGEWNATPGIELVDKLMAVFDNVGKRSRDKNDLSYERPLTVAKSRIGTSIPS